jgi:hypothetical protein
MARKLCMAFTPQEQAAWLSDPISETHSPCFFCLDEFRDAAQRDRLCHCDHWWWSSLQRTRKKVEQYEELLDAGLIEPKQVPRRYAELV